MGHILKSWDNDPGPTINLKACYGHVPNVRTYSFFPDLKENIPNSRNKEKSLPFSDFIWQFLTPNIGLIPNPKTGCIFPIFYTTTTTTNNRGSGEGHIDDAGLYFPNFRQYFPNTALKKSVFAFFNLDRGPFTGS